MPCRHIAVIAMLAAVALSAPSTAVAQVQPHRANDPGGFWDVLPPGTTGVLSGPELAAFLAFGTKPEHYDDQLAMYGDLVYATPGLTEADLPKYFKEASFGVKPEDVARRYSPREDVTILRDRQFGVPHVYGTTREGAMFGLGYIAAEDRLFFIDVLRNLGRAQVSSFVGGAPSNRALDQEQWEAAPYTEADFQRQIDQFDDLYGADGQTIQSDVAHYTAGVNAYIAEAQINPMLLPGEYSAIGRPGGPEPWRQTDIVATASLVGAIFGKGGGGELGMAEFLQALQGRFGARTGRRLWYQLGGYDDPEAPTTVRERRRGKRVLGRFPYQRPPRRPAAGAEALPDAGSLQGHRTVVAGPDAGEGRVRARPALPLHHGQSNALLVSRKRSKSGHPLAVFGPQTGYFNPQILMEQDVHAPGIDARGAAFPGVNLYVQLGRGRDYSWSATSAGQDIIDTFAVPLCEPDGAAPTLDSQHYVFRGQCTAMEVLERTNSWTPSAADQTPPGSQTLRALRTKLGIVRARGTVKGKPVAFTALRSTYMHEVDSAPGFADLNNPDKIRSARDFQRATHKIGYTFNWFYADDRQIAYFNSGNNPVRRRGTTGQLPMDARHEWIGYDPEQWTARYTPMREHPQVVDQEYITSWNNRQAPRYAGAENNLFSSVYRSQMLDREIETRLRGKRKMTLVQLIDAMEEAGTTDLRGEIVLPWALKVIGTPEDPDLRKAVETLRAWVGAGAHRRDRDRDRAYEHAEAVRIMDAWWPRWTEAQFKPVLGDEAFEAIPHGIDNDPNNHGAHLGSAYQNGWYGWVHKDLRAVLGRKVRGRYARRFCGAGSRSRCRDMLLSTLAEAVKAPPTEVYPGDGVCEAGDQWCWDAVRFTPLGGGTQPLIHWINRPTYQQAVEIQGRAPR